MKTLETLILSNLIHNEAYMRKVIPFIRDDYFLQFSERYVFTLVKDFTDQYSTVPSTDALFILAQNDQRLGESDYKEVHELLERVQPTTHALQWLYDETEKFCKEKALHNAIMQSIQIIDGRDKQMTPDAIPTLLQEALAVSFDSSIGHDFLEDAEARHDFYTSDEDRTPFDLVAFNRITKGGVPRKTLNIAMAGPGVGKSLWLCHVAAGTLLQGKNVLYITMEMAQERIAERVDANMLNIVLDDLPKTAKSTFLERINRVRLRTAGKLIIKEYPTSSAHAGHFRALLNDLRIKKEFVPEIIIVDYLNICASSRYKPSGNVNAYTYVKAIAEELRALAVEFEVAMFSATQLNRVGSETSEVELSHTSESFGIPATADLMFAMITNDDLEALGQIMVKQLKNRYADMNLMKRFVVGVDKTHMRLFDVIS